MVKQPLVWQWNQASPTNGNRYTLGAKVPYGEHWKITAATCKWTGLLTTDKIHFLLEKDGTYFYFGSGAAGINDLAVSWAGEITVPAGYRLGMYCSSLAKNDDVTLSAFGYRYVGECV